MSAYRYRTWINILTKVEMGREYKVNKDREDYEEFVEALKSFAAHQWNFYVKTSREGDISFIMLDPVKSAQELLDLCEFEEGTIEIKKDVSKKDDFYTKAYYPENLRKQKELWSKTKT